MGETTAVVLLDFDNFYPRRDPTQTQNWLPHQINAWVSLALDAAPVIDRLEIRLYGGWLEDGLMTPAASAIHGVVATVGPFPMPHPNKAGLLRGSLELVTRLIEVPEIEWMHTRRTRRGLPRLQMTARPLPIGCVHDEATCPLRAVHRFSQKRTRVCYAPGCGVRNEEAFEVAEQKMVDSLICCDVIGLARSPTPPHLLVLSDDLDVLPAVAVAARTAPVSLVRAAGRESLYEQGLADLAVGMRDFDV